MLKAEMKERLDELEPMVEDLESQIESLTTTNSEMAAAIEELTEERDDLQHRLETAQATLDSTRQIPEDTDDPKAVRDWIMTLLQDLARARGVHPATQRALTPALGSLAMALRGRWPDEDDPCPERAQRVREILETKNPP